MKSQEVLKYLEEIMEMDEGTLSENMILADIDEWDSLSRLSLLADAEEKFQKQVDNETIKKFETVKDICTFFA